MAKKNDAPTTLEEFSPLRYLRYSLHCELSRPQQLKAILSGWDKLHRDPNFLKACDEYFENPHRDRLHFFDQWGTFPVFSFMFSGARFQEGAEKAAEKAGATKTIVVYPWTSTKELILNLKADGFLNSKIKVDYQELRRKLFIYFLNQWGFTARDIAEAVGDNTSEKSQKKYSSKLNQRELNKADAIFKKLRDDGIEYKTADCKAMRRVKKARYKEASVIPAYRMASNRALKDLLKISHLIKSYSRPRS